jgi:hypothetical protein
MINEGNKQDEYLEKKGESSKTTAMRKASSRRYRFDVGDTHQNAERENITWTRPGTRSYDDSLDRQRKSAHRSERRRKKPQAGSSPEDRRWAEFSGDKPEGKYQKLQNQKKAGQRTNIKAQKQGLIRKGERRRELRTQAVNAIRRALGGGYVSEAAENKIVELHREQKTFSEFLEIAEKYYPPDWKLPSGNTPLGNALKKQEKNNSEIGPNSDIVRMRRHFEKIETKVKHGADNPEYNARVNSRDDDEIHVDSDGTNYITVYHKPSKVTYNVVRQPGPGNIHSVEWGHQRGSSFMLGRSQRNSISRDARRVWDQHVSHRLPYGATLHNQPAKEGLGKIYKRSGFGDVDSDNDQFAKVGREKSPKQKAKGKKSRLTTLDSKKVKRDAGWERN